ncbi:hypothetical protein BDV12DRAFT_181235 [Aspergillus spectabilis]
MPLETFTQGIISKVLAELFKLLADPNVVLTTITDIFLKGEHAVIRDLILSITRHAVRAMSIYLGHAPAIYDSVFKNSSNKDALNYILKERSQLVQFLIDMVEPAKRFAMSDSLDGEPSSANTDRNKFNELDLHDDMNRYAVLCQAQRLVKSLIIVLKKDDTADETFDTLYMDTRLEHDAPVDIESEEGDTLFQEDWFFINGIGGEPYWVKAACDKLAGRFGRKVMGVFNQSEGLIWDLIECSGERSPTGGKSELVERTQSSRYAQGVLKEKLEAATAKKVILIAHSQGCLITRLILQELVKQDKHDLLGRLRVFTFGSPSYDWKFPIPHMEHFYNMKDFVAKLGVGRDGRGDLYDGTIFRNLTWPGHLFCAQYSFDPRDYDREDSKLLACFDGRNPQPLSG